MKNFKEEILTVGPYSYARDNSKIWSVYDKVNQLTGIYLLKQSKVPSANHILKGLESIFLKSKFDEASFGAGITYNRYLILPKQLRIDMLDMVLSMIKESGNKKGNNLSWLTPLIDLKLSRVKFAEHDLLKEKAKVSNQKVSPKGRKKAVVNRTGGGISGVYGSNLYYKPMTETESYGVKEVKRTEEPNAEDLDLFWLPTPATKNASSDEEVPRKLDQKETLTNEASEKIRSELESYLRISPINFKTRYGTNEINESNETEF